MAEEKDSPLMVYKSKGVPSMQIPAEVVKKNLWFKLTRISKKGYPLMIGPDATVTQMEDEWNRIMQERTEPQKC